MKPFLFLLIAFFGMGALQAQDYFVIHVKGDIRLNQTNLKSGDKFNSTDELTLLSQDAVAVVMSPTEGRLVIDGNKAEKNKEGEFIGLARYLLVPMKKNMQMSTRGADDEQVVDLKSYLGNDKFAIIGQELAVAIDPSRFPVSADQVFIFRYKYEGRDVPKVMDTRAGKLLFNKDQLFQSNGQAIDPSAVEVAEIHYGSKASRSFQKITAIQPLFLDEDILEKELKTLTAFLKEKMKMEGEEIKTELERYMLDVYGQTDLVVFNNWLGQRQIN